MRFHLTAPLLAAAALAMPFSAPRALVPREHPSLEGTHTLPFVTANTEAVSSASTHAASTCSYRLTSQAHVFSPTDHEPSAILVTCVLRVALSRTLS